MIRTLVVEDDALVAEVHASYVDRVAGFALVGVAHRATEALEVIAARPVDLVLLDLHLPDARGMDFLRVLRARAGAPVDVIAVTADREAETIRDAITQGINQYLVKPFTFATFADRLERYARHRSRVAREGPLDQDEVDALLGQAPAPGRRLPKGLNAATLARVRDALRQAERSLTATEVAGLSGVSRVTARRYLEHLAVEGSVEVSMRYGGTGRPEHLYAWAAGGGGR